jgi:ABC-2 type transport system ATP-binding protein
MFLTTHYMEEADRLCGRLAIIDHGRIAAAGSPGELKRRIGADTVTLRLGADSAEALARAQDEAERRLAGFEPLAGFERSADGIVLAVSDAESAIPGLLRRLDDAEVAIVGLAMDKPSLDDVFLQVTGRRIRAEEANQPIDLGWMQ